MLDEGFDRLEDAGAYTVRVINFSGSVTSAAALLSVQVANAGTQELFVLEDVRGDDVGNGELIYPNRIDMQREALQKSYTRWYGMK